MPTCSPGEATPTRREVGCRAKAGHTHFIPGPPRAQPPSPLCWGDGASLLIGPETVLLSEQRPPGTRLRLAMEPMGLGPASLEHTGPISSCGSNMHTAVPWVGEIT